jgi:hypothetical protein
LVVVVVVAAAVDVVVVLDVVVGGGGGGGRRTEWSALSQVLNEKALAVIRRVQDKLTGRDFAGDFNFASAGVPCGVADQVVLHLHRHVTAIHPPRGRTISSFLGLFSRDDRCVWRAIV